MEDNRTLVITFLNSEGKKSNIRIPYVKEELTGIEVKNLMDSFINAKAILCDGNQLVSKQTAKIIAQSVNEITL